MLVLRLSLWACVWVAWAASQDPPSLAERLEHARAILSEVPLVDGHNDLPGDIRKVVHNQLEYFPFEEDLTQLEPWASLPDSHTDLPRLREGMVGSQFWSAFVPCGSQYKNAVTQVMEQIDVIHRLVEKYPDDLQYVTTADGILEAHDQDRIGSLIGVEGGHNIHSSLAVLRLFYNEGVRYMTLTHKCNTPWADNYYAESGEFGQEIEFDGLTTWGELVVKEMNRLGMMVDLAHVAAQTMRDSLDVSRAPVIFSHSNARGLVNISRNIPDDVLERLPANGGIAMVNFKDAYVTENVETASIKDVVAQINYIRDVAGVDYVGIGADYNGITTLPEGLEDVSKYPYLFAELLLDPTWTDEDLKKLAGLNLVRVMRQVEQVRDSLFYEAPWDLPIPAEDVADHLECVNPWP